MNFLVSISFIPEISRTLFGWPPVMPERINENYDAILTTPEARLTTLLLSDYAVTPDLLLANHQEIIQNPFSNTPEIDTNHTIVFYVSPEDFENFTRELCDLEEITWSVHDYIRMSTIKDSRFLKFIISQIMNSKNFSARDSVILKTSASLPLR